MDNLNNWTELNRRDVASGAEGEDDLAAVNIVDVIVVVVADDAE